MKIAIIGGASKKGDSVRGIGVHSTELIKSINQLITNSVNNIQIEETNLSALFSNHFNSVHFTAFRPFFISLPFSKPKNTKFILTIHDLIPLIYPSVYKSGIRGKLNLLINKFLVRMYVDQIITISETSKKDIVRFMGVDPKNVNVIYLAPKSAINSKSVAKKYDLPKKFVLYVGDINYNKNIPNLVKACEIAKIPLVIAGKQAMEVEKMDLTHPETFHLAGVNWSNVIRLGFVPDDELNDLYNLAYCYVQASFYEGFGLPALEAAICNTPLVASRTQALVEILGTNINYVDPYSPEDIARGIRNPNKNIKLPREYSWKKAAQETLDVYRKVIGEQ